MPYGNTIVGYTTTGQPIYSTSPVDTPRLNFPVPNNQLNQQVRSQIEQPAQTGMIWVDGFIEAKSYRVAPGSTVVLWDSEAGNKAIYIKSTDANGIPQKMRILKYEDVTDGYESGSFSQEANTVITLETVEELIDKKLEEYSNRTQNAYKKNRGRKQRVREEYDEE